VLLYETCDCFQQTAISEALSWDSEDDMGEFLRVVLSQLIAGCADYLSITTQQHYRGASSTRLDKIRTEFCRTEVVNNSQYDTH
jgi:hypothetical protein